MGSVNVDGWADPTFDYGRQESVMGNDNQTGTGIFSNWATAAGTQSGTADPNKLYNTSDLSRFMGNIGMDPMQFGAAPDYSKFYTPETAKQLVSVAGNDSGTETWYDNPDYKAASFDTAGATKAYNEYQSMLAGKLGLDPNARYLYSNQSKNPTSALDSRDTVDALYKYNADANTYDPLAAFNHHNNSSWVENRGTYGMMAAALATILSAGAASGAFAGLGAAEAGTAGAVSGMDLAADAGMMGANGIGGAAAAWDGAALGGMSGMDLAADAGSMGANSIDGAAAGWDAGVGASSNGSWDAMTSDGYGGDNWDNFGNMGGGGGGSGSWYEPAAGSGSSYLKNAKDAYDLAKQGKGLYDSLTGAGGSGGKGGSSGAMGPFSGGMSAGDRYRQQLAANAIRELGQKEPGFQSVWSGPAQ